MLLTFVVKLPILLSMFTCAWE